MKKSLLLGFLVTMWCALANAQLSVFSDSYGAGATFVPFGGSTNSVTIDNAEFNTGTSSLRVEVPASGYTGGALVAAAGQNLSSYNAISFWVKASASKTLNVSGICNNSVSAQYGAEYNNLAVNTTWRQYIIPIPDASKLTSEDGLFHFAEGSDQGAYTLWFDDIEYVNSPAVGTFSPAIGSQTVTRAINGTFNVFGQVLNVLVNGSNQTINVALASFNFSTSNAAVATVNSTGTITAVGAGSAIITATLNGVTATGSVTMNVSAAPAAPTVAAPVPTMSSANVISLFSNTYTNISGINWTPSWGQSTIVTDILVAGNTTKKYENFNYQGVEFASPVNASAMQFLHLDVWTPNCTSFEVFLINNSPAPTVEQRVVLTPTLSGWNSFDIPLSSYNTIALNRINQLKLVGTPFGSSQVYLDNIYFYFDPNTPAIAAPTPTTPAPNVISIYSGAYTNLAGTNFNPPWGQSTVATEVMVAGNATRKYANFNYQGIEFAAPVNASSMQTLHLDLWTPNCTAFEVFLINAGPIERSFTVTPTLSGWNSIEIPLSAYTPTIDLSSIIQIKLVGTPFGSSTAFVDNIYFYTVPSSPLAAAPTPTHSAANVISLFSNAYTDVAGTNWFPNWGQNTTVTDVQVLGDDTKRYDGLDYQGVQLANPMNVTGMQFLHLDLWTANCNSFQVYLISTGPVERSVTVTPTALGWNSYNIPLSSFAGVNLSDVIQLKFVGSPSGSCQVYLDNIYFYTIPNTPTVAAPTPTWPSSNVISLFSNAYTNVPGTDWFPNWGQSTTVTDIQVAGNDTKRYTGLNYQGVAFTGSINASGMQYLHLDLWTTNCTAFEVFLINPGPVERSVTLNPTALGWNSFDIPLSSYTPTVNLSNIFQLKLVGTPFGSSRVFLDNIYFYTDPNTPITAAPTPTTPSADVISLFSNAYTNVTGTDWFPNWGQSTVVTDVQIAGNATKKYENLNYQGVVFSNPIDASGMQYLHLDVWTPNCTAFEVFLINPGPVERGFTVTPTLSGWNSIDIPLSAYTPTVNLSSIFQLKLVGTPAGTSKVFLDNVYFYTVPTGPTVAAPTPTTPAPNVISIYSGAYTNLAGTNFNPSWGQSTVATEVMIAGDATRKYENMNYQGVEFAAPVDASGMQTLHLDLWTPNCTAFKVFLVNAGGVERSYTVTPTLSGWNSVNIPLTAYTPTINLSNIIQFKFESVPFGSGIAYVDNIYFFTIPTAPLVAAPTPTTPSADVISLFSNAYTNVPGTDWFPNWSQSTQVTDVQIAGNDTKRYTNFNYQGVQFAAPIDASAMQVLHLDLWTTNCTAFEVFLVNTSPGTVEQRVVVNPTLYGWNSIDIPLSSYSAINLSNIGQFKFVGTPFGSSRVFLDNIYFYKELTPVVAPGNISCNGGTTTVTVTAFGGAGGYAGTGTFVRSAGTHTFTVTDASGAIATTSVVISQPAVLTASAMAETVTCLSPTANVTVSANGGTSPYAGVGVFPRAAGTFAFTVSDANGCTASQSVNVSQNLVVTQASITSSAGTAICPGQSTNLIAMPSGNQYRWSTNATTQSITVNSLSTFRVTVTYSNAACTTTASTTITAQVDNTPPTVTCLAAQSLNGSGSVVIPDYTSMVTATDNCSQVVVTQSPVAGTLYTATGTYAVEVTVTARDASNNVNTCAITVNVSVTPGPVYLLGGDNTCNFRYFWPLSGAVVGSTNASTSCYSVYGNNIGSTGNNEPTDCGSASDRGVWYFFRMPGCGTSGPSPLGVKISTNNAGTLLAGTNLAVYSVTNSNSCTGAGYANIGCSTNSVVAGCNGTAGTNAHGTLEFGPGKPNGPLMANGDYFIYVSGDNGSQGNFELSFEYTGDRNIGVAAGPSQTQAVMTVPNNGQGSFKPQWRPMGSTGWASINGLVTGNSFTLPANSLMPGVNYEFRALYACASTFNFVMASNIANFATTPNVSSCGPVTGLTCNAVAGNVTTTWNTAPAGTTGNLVVVARSGSRQLVGTVVPSTATGATLTCAGCTATNTSFTLQSSCGGSAYIASGNCAVSAAGQAAQVQTVSFEHNGIVYEDVDFNDPSWGLFGAQPAGDFEMSVANGQLIITDESVKAAGFDFELRPSVALDFTNVVISTEKAVDAQLSLSDMNGTVINTRTLKQVQNGTVVTLETSELPTGLYIVSVRTEEGNVAKKLVKIN